MGLFKKLSVKKQSQRNEVFSHPGSKTGRIGILKESCELIAESRKQIEEAKAEYQMVTSYLTDMQKIDLIPKEQRQNMEDAARRIISLSRERENYQRRNTSITDIQYRLFERYEEQIPKELVNLRESENYQELIHQDIERLEQEKQNLSDEVEEIRGRQSFLKGIAITTCIIIILLFLIIAFLGGLSKANLILPFLLTILMGMASALYLFIEARKITHDLRLAGIKQNRQISLMNKVKIKSVNNRNYLEYACSKYMVDNYEQFKARWEEYVKVKDETRRYQSNTELLEFYNNELIKELVKAGIADSEIWIYQPSAILDGREMVEVRHRLNVRRQKLRERIESDSRQIEEAIRNIREARKAYPELEDETIHILKRYNINAV